MTHPRDIAHADLSLIEEQEFHIAPNGLVTIDGESFTLEQVDPELAERELAAVRSRYAALCKRPRSRHAWNAIAVRLWNVLQGPANAAMLPPDSERRRAVLGLYNGAMNRADVATRTGRAV